MRVVVWPAGLDDDGTAQYRMLMPAAALAAAGADVVVDRIGPKCEWDRVWEPPDPPLEANVESVFDPSEWAVPADVVVMQRPARKFWAQMIPMLQKKGVRVIVDVDDRFDAIHQMNVAWPSYQPHLNRHHSYEWVARACEAADLVTCTTPALAEVYGFGHARVLPNLVPERYLSVEPDEERLDAIGWAGTVETHPTDLQVTGGAVARALERSSWGFHVVGTGRGVRGALGLSQPVSTSLGWVSFSRYPAKLAELGIGIVPLERSPFNLAKSALKMAEMAAVGVPVVVSPTPDNERLHRLGIGLVATNPNRWQKALRALLHDPERRADLAGRGRAAMAGQTYERLGHLWWEAWSGEGLARAAS